MTPHKLVSISIEKEVGLSFIGLGCVLARSSERMLVLTSLDVVGVIDDDDMEDLDAKVENQDVLLRFSEDEQPVPLPSLLEGSFAFGPGLSISTLRVLEAAPSPLPQDSPALIDGGWQCPQLGLVFQNKTNSKWILFAGIRGTEKSWPASFDSGLFLPFTSLSELAESLLARSGSLLQWLPTTMYSILSSEMAEFHGKRG